MEDERLSAIETEKQNALNQSNSVYSDMLKDNEDLYNSQNQYAEEYERVTNENLDKQLAYNTSLIEQQKEEATKNKETEEKKALNDYTSFINPYGYEAENLASRGLNNSGVSETSMLGGFNTYQNRLASANKALQSAITEYDNAINQARLENDATKAQNALNKLQMMLQNQENYVSSKNTISQNQLSNNQSLDSEYYNRYQTEYNNIQTEKAQEEAIRQWEAELAEKQRQYDETMAYQKTLAEQEQANWEKEYALSKASVYSSGSSGGSGSSETLTENNIETIENGLFINPYTNTVNADAKYGVFSNGYQPDNINGAKLKKSGKTVSQFTGESGNLNSGNANIDNQNVWKLNNRYYAWDGYQNKYVDITSRMKSAVKKTTTSALPSYSNTVNNPTIK